MSPGPRLDVTSRGSQWIGDALRESDKATPCPAQHLRISTGNLDKHTAQRAREPVPQIFSALLGPGRTAATGRAHLGDSGLKPRVGPATSGALVGRGQAVHEMVTDVKFDLDNLKIRL